jgi:hypothetical protein
MSATVFTNVSLCMFASYASLRKRALSKSNIVDKLFVFLTISFRCADVRGLRIYGTVLSLWDCTEFMGLYSFYTSFYSFAAHLGLEMVFSCYYLILFINLPFSIIEAFFILSSLITQNTSDVQMFLWLRCIPHTE